MKSGGGTSGIGFSSSGASPSIALAALAAVPGTFENNNDKMNE